MTIIAMFAVIAEVSGTIVLPLLHAEVQQIYVWFLMIFPTLLVALFFYTLHTKRDALYGPGDYNDERNFMSLVRPANQAEVALKNLGDIDEGVAAEAQSIQPVVVAQDGKLSVEAADKPPVDKEPAPEAGQQPAPKETEAAPFKTSAQIVTEALQQTNAGQLSNAILYRRRDRDRALASLEHLYGPIRTDMMVMGHVVDGFAGSKADPIVIETAHITPRTPLKRIVGELNNLVGIAQNLKTEKVDTVTALLVFIVERRYELLARERSQYLESLASAVHGDVKVNCHVFVVEDRTEDVPVTAPSF
ncbi:hypothetical protein [Achromobacter spanius]|uniref:hypothetical protein n=1 Tax=Achromobacter spanius TaxID=217203 RepID=UPI00320B1A3A